ncbi:MAG: hypothetical protein JHC71_14655 [Blastococcus sp.]|nr:hypothetical protein [Blastococcus sp.]
MRSVYLYLVCLSMLLVVVFAAVQLVRSALDLAFPDPVLPFSWSATAGPDPGLAFLSDEQYGAGLEAGEDAQRRQAARDAVVAGTTLLIAGSIYVLHWRRVQADRAGAATDEAPAAATAP